MEQGKFVVALAARAHALDGSHRHDADARARLRTAAGSSAERLPGALAAPSEVTDDATLLMQLSSPAACLDVILRVADELRPLETTFSVVVLDTIEASTTAGSATRRQQPVAGETASESPDQVIAGALANVDRAVTMANQILVETDVKISRVVVAGPRRDPVLSALIDMILEAYDSMTSRQRQILDLVKRVGAQQRVAKHLGVSRQAVNQSLASSGWHHIRHAEDTARDRLARVGQDW